MPEIDESLSGVTISRYIDCDNRREVLLYTLHGVDHLIPPDPVGTPGGIFGLIWKFFERNARPFTGRPRVSE